MITLFHSSWQLKVIKVLVFYTFIFNSLFGYNYMNIMFFSIPLNEIVLSLGLILGLKYIKDVVKYFKIIKPILFWSIFFIPFAIYGVLFYGKYALRDASHMIEVWWIPLTIISCHNLNEKTFYKLIKILSFIFLIKTILDFLPLSNLIVINGLHGEVDLFKKSNAMIIISSFCFWAYILKLHKYIIIVALYVLSLALNQSRTGIFAFILMVFLYLYISNYNLKSIRKILGYFVIFISLYLLILNFSGLNNFTKFGKLLTIEQYYELLLSSTGESKTFEGSAEGVEKRIRWRENIFRESINDVKVFFFGQGFGMPLTDFYVKENVIVREPHNSFLSVFARTGIIGFSIWFFFHLKLNIHLIKLLKNKNHKKNIYYYILFCCFLSLINVYVLCLTQPGFENPYTSIPSYILIGTIVFLIKNYKSKIQFNLNKKSI